MDPDIGAEPAGWTAFGVFSTLTVVAAARMIIHLPTGRQSVCGAALGFHAVLLLWTLALTVSSALFVLPWNTSFDNLLLDNAANCFSLTVRPAAGWQRSRARPGTRHERVCVCATGADAADPVRCAGALARIP